MAEYKIPRASAFTLDVSIPRSWRPGDDVVVCLVDGSGKSVRVTLERRWFRVLHIVIMESIVGERDRVPEELRGYVTTESIRRSYAEQVGDRVLPQSDLIFSHISGIRKAVRLAIEELARERRVALDPSAEVIEHRRGFGYRIGGVDIVVHDYRVHDGAVE